MIYKVYSEDWSGYEYENEFHDRDKAIEDAKKLFATETYSRVFVTENQSDNPEFPKEEIIWDSKEVKEDYDEFEMDEVEEKENIDQPYSDGLNVGDHVVIKGLAEDSPWENLEGEIIWIDEEDFGDDFQTITVRVNFPTENGTREVNQNFDRKNIFKVEKEPEPELQPEPQPEPEAEPDLYDSAYESLNEGEGEEECFFDIVFKEKDDDEEKTEKYDDPDGAKADFLHMTQDDKDVYQYVVLRKICTDYNGSENIEVIDSFGINESLEEDKDMDKKELDLETAIKAADDEVLDGEFGVDTPERKLAGAIKAGPEEAEVEVETEVEEPIPEPEVEEPVEEPAPEEAPVEEPQEEPAPEAEVKKQNTETIELPHEEYTEPEDLKRVNDELSKKADEGKIIGIRKEDDMLMLAEPEINGIWIIYLNDKGYIKKIVLF